MSNPEIFNPPFSKILENIRGSEGPVFDKNEAFFMVAPEVEENKQFAGEILKVDLKNKKADVVSKPVVDGYGGIPAGCQCDLENNIWVADMRLGVLKMGQDCNFKQMFQVDSEGRPAQGCNDCIFDYDGNLWVTAPAGDIAPAPFRRSMEEAFGSVYCVAKGDEKLVRIETGLKFPNGLAVLHGADGKPSKLIVAETPTKLLWQYDILGPAKVGPKSVWGKLPGDHIGGPDGMDFDVDDNLIVANHGASHLEVFSRDGGSPITRIKCPFKFPSNVHFQPGTSTVYVTEHEFDGLWKFDWKRVGKKQFCEL